MSALKSLLIPQQKITFLGFVIDSVNMIVRLTEDKIFKIKEILQCTIHNSHSVKIRDIARIVGYMISSLPDYVCTWSSEKYCEEKSIREKSGD